MSEGCGEFIYHRKGYGNVYCQENYLCPKCKNHSPQGEQEINAKSKEGTTLSPQDSESLSLYDNAPCEELKTLKDIELGICEGSNFVIDNIRQEAIKWVKYYQDTKQPLKYGFMEFFNLTEEDLK